MSLLYVGKLWISCVQFCQGRALVLGPGYVFVDEGVFILIGCTFELAGKKASRRFAFEFAGYNPSGEVVGHRAGL